MRAPDSEYQSNRCLPDRPERKIRKRATRWVLAATVASSILLVVTETIFNSPVRSLMPDLMFVELPIVAATWGSPFARDSWATRRGLAQYDEFERATLGRAMFTAYAALLVGEAGVLGLFAFALSVGYPIVVTPRLLLLWAMGIFSNGFALPALVAEWTVPFPDPEDQPL